MIAVNDVRKQFASVTAGAPELLLSLGLLVGGIALLRIAAGRIFSIAMLMYGKEPSWVELRRWALGR